MKRLYLFLGSLLFSLVLFAQPQPNREIYKVPDIAPKSPDVSSLFKFSDVPVDHSSGTATVTIPIYTINAGRIQIPISISYNTAGIKVQDISSSVGLGWALDYGGYVVSINGDNDQGTFSGRMVKNYTQAATATSNYANFQNNMQLVDVANGYWDQEQLNFNFRCGNLSGTFMYDQNNQLQVLCDDKNVKIELIRFNNTTSGQITGCKITTGEGIEYLFDQIESYVNTRKRTSPINSAFYLSQIKDLVTGETVGFSYLKKPVYKDYRSEEYSTKDAGSPQCIPCCYAQESPDCNWQNPLSDQINNPRYRSSPFDKNDLHIEAITFRGGNVSFALLTDRLDIDKVRLSEINIVENTNGLNVKQVSFSQSYFESTSIAAGIDTKYKYRLKLDRVSFRSRVQTGNPNDNETYKFEYEQTIKLPSYRIKNTSVNNTETNSCAIDFWGFYNGQDNSMDPTPDGIYTQRQGYSTSSAMNNRKPNPAFTQACILKKIIYPTLGCTVFEYENHQSAGYYLSDNLGNLGGLRVKSIKNFADSQGNSLVSQKNYNYLSGTPLTPADINMFSYKKTKTYIGAPNINGVYGINVYPNFIYVTSNPLYEIIYHSGSPVLYNKVEEWIGTTENNAGKIVYTFENPETSYLIDRCAVKEYGLIRKNPIVNKIGLPKQIEYYRVSDVPGGSGTIKRYDILKKEVYEYTTTSKLVVAGLHVFKSEAGFISNFVPGSGSDMVGPSIQTVYANQYFNGNLVDQTRFFEFYEPRYYYINKKISKKEVSEYDIAEREIKTTTRYFYDNAAHTYLTRIETVGSDGKTKKTLYRYPQDRSLITDIDASETTALNNLVSRNRYDDILEEIEYSNDQPLIRKRVRFGTWPNTQVGSMSLPGSYEESRMFNSVWETRKILIKKYDNWGNIWSQQKENDIEVVNIWGYNAVHPVAVIKKASYDEVKAALGSINDISLGVNGLSSDQINLLRSKLPQAFISLYDYNPLGGIRSTTDVNIVSTTFEYDGLQRLKAIKDRDGNLLKTYTYYNKNEF
ncbi:hypothetical protein QNI19_37325 [Cytophagaceae bacterium DM2B3-1]|uniref:YD repeat-containing protein n=1 Tax=Xanthocytophaga flava TaxID=3048013 RepID=A0ABT7D1J3_9BACT|nr:hypothetical protein [Xanthocytophaga flavus]MDJ1498654.1 hypothetical protein [Xanthocytophaga flavus]